MDISPLTGELYASVNTVGDGGTGGDHLAKINKTTGVASIVGAYGICEGTGCSIQGLEGIAFNPIDGQLWGTYGRPLSHHPALSGRSWWW